MPITIAGSGTISGVNATGLTTAQTVTSAALSGDAIPIGVSQTWQDVLASRSTGVTYTNSTGRPIQVNVQSSQTGGSNPSTYITVSGVKSAQDGQSNVAGGGTMSVIVPNGGTYVVTTAGNAPTIWIELR